MHFQHSQYVLHFPKSRDCMFFRISGFFGKYRFFEKNHVWHTLFFAILSVFFSCRNTIICLSLILFRLFLQFLTRLLRKNAKYCKTDTIGRHMEIWKIVKIAEMIRKVIISHEISGNRTEKVRKMSEKIVKWCVFSEIVVVFRLNEAIFCSKIGRGCS